MSKKSLWNMEPTWSPAKLCIAEKGLKALISLGHMEPTQKSVKNGAKMGHPGGIFFYKKRP